MMKIKFCWRCYSFIYPMNSNHVHRYFHFFIFSVIIIILLEVRGWVVKIFSFFSSFNWEWKKSSLLSLSLCLVYLLRFFFFRFFSNFFSLFPILFLSSHHLSWICQEYFQEIWNTSEERKRKWEIERARDWESERERESKENFRKIFISTLIPFPYQLIPGKFVL